MGIRQKSTAPVTDTNQLRASAGTAGKNASKSFASVDPVQKKDAAQFAKEDDALSLKADPAVQMNPLEKEEL
jgi:hypothetical protein